MAEGQKKKVEYKVQLLDDSTISCRVEVSGLSRLPLKAPLTTAPSFDQAQGCRFDRPLIQPGI